MTFPSLLHNKRTHMYACQLQVLDQDAKIREKNNQGMASKLKKGLKKIQSIASSISSSRANSRTNLVFPENMMGMFVKPQDLLDMDLDD